jgi:hypothetical protein
MGVPLYSQYRGGFDTGVLELCTDWITIQTVNTRKEAPDGGSFYLPSLTYGQLTASSLTNPFAATPSKDPFFFQSDDNPASIALFRCQFVLNQKEERDVAGGGLVIAGRYVLPAAPWFTYQAFMNLYNWFYKRDNVDLQNPKGYEKINVSSIEPLHDLNRNISHYEIRVAR